MCLPWGRGGGKSWFQRLIWYTEIARWDGRLRPGATHPGVRIVLLMPTLEQAKKVHASLMVAELEGEWAWLGGKINRAEWKVTFPGGSQIQFATAERPQGLRGLRLDIASLDECDDIDVELYQAITIPWFSEHHSLRMLVASGTPTRGQYGLLWKLHAQGIGKELDSDSRRFENQHSVHATCYDFPEHVSPIAIEESRRETTPALFRREWLCDFVSAEGLVYSVFDQDINVREAHPETVFSEFFIGVDHGFEDPGVFLCVGRIGSGADATYWVVDELCARHRTEEFWVDAAVSWASRYPGARWYADPSMPARIVALSNAVREFGGQMDPALNPIEDGVNLVANLLIPRLGHDGVRRARLHISPTCTNLLEELGKYRRRRDPRNRERILDDIEDRWNHSADALRYALFSRLGGPKGGRIERGYGDFRQE